MKKINILCIHPGWNRTNEGNAKAPLEGTLNINEEDKKKYSESFNYISKWFEKITKPFPCDELIIVEGDYPRFDYLDSCHTRIYMSKEHIEYLFSNRNNAVKTFTNMLTVAKAIELDRYDELTEMKSNLRRYMSLENSKISLKKMKEEIVTTSKLIKDLEEYFENEV